MLLVELQSLVNALGKRQSIGDGGLGVVSVTCPVDLATLYHHEEAVVVVEHFDSLVNVIRKSPLAFLAVVAVGHRVAVCKRLSDENGFAILRGELFSFGVCCDDIVACFLCKIVYAGLVLVVAGGLLKRTACEVIEAALYHFNAYLIIVVPACLVSVVSSGSCVVQIYRRDNADLVAHLGFQLFSNGLILCGHGLVHVDGAAVSLVSGGEGGRGGSGIRAERGTVICICGAYYREFRKVEVSVCLKDIVVVGVSERAVIVSGDLGLGEAHSVADEHEYVLRHCPGVLLRARCNGGLGSVCRGYCEGCRSGCDKRSSCTDGSNDLLCFGHCCSPFYSFVVPFFGTVILYRKNIKSKSAKV
ncbi:unknown [Eubacterium sp. CAG:786]|nr:unknown [Eubacterium sp. CAG:786]